ncbi:hypothetical protein QBC34DRAFT_427411 [Podospora aff. communis PSN243]|uniref:Uncharacterized protein n=1 Tax=Podospora aff. communis PSN243 TaxID=3040156 RepID=A0AAV9GJ11_9PEZI|nr:hypothetical protein QBC34DRAFT_427411 [Podospora aff. communis PSN243]
MANLTPELYDKLCKNMPGIRGYTLTSPAYVPLRTVQGAKTPLFSTSGIDLWSSSNASFGVGVNGVTAATVSLQSSPVTISMTWDHFPRVNVMGDDWQGTALWTFSGVFASDPRITITQTFTKANATRLQRPSNFPGPPICPGVSWGNISWSAKIVFEGETITVPDFAQTPIELYAISPKLPVMYKSPGAPLELLRLFVAPAYQDASVVSLDSWVAWVVKRCHASLADHDPDLDVSVPMAQRIHSFIYDVWSGGMNYASAYNGQTFSLDYWLADYKNPAAWNEVNCYDQAALVQLVTLLGVAVDRIGWVYKQPFGYIVPTDLIGWGKTNNPYYGNDGSKKLIDQDKVAADAQPFGNHAFIRYTNSAGTSVALDACAGPHTGDQTVEAYLTDSIDDTDGITTAYYQTWKHNRSIQALSVSNGMGVTSYTDDRSAYYNLQSTGGVTTYADLTSTKGAVAAWAAFAKFVKQAPTESKQIDLATFFAQLQTAVTGCLPNMPLYFTTSKPLAQMVSSKTVSYRAGTDVFTSPPDVINAATTPQRPLLSMTVRVLETPDLALQDLASWMRCLSRDPASLFVASETQSTNPDSDDDLGPAHLRLTAKAPSGLNIFCYLNMVVWVQAQDYQTGLSVAAAAEKLLNAATSDTTLLTVDVSAPSSSTYAPPEPISGPLADGQAVPEEDGVDQISFVVVAAETQIVQLQTVEVALQT